MRNRIKIERVSDIKKDPDMRMVFTKEHYPEFLQILGIGEDYKLNPTTLSRNVLLIWNRKFQGAADKETKDKMILEIIQSIHGVHQMDLLAKGEQWENISVSTEKNLNSQDKGKPGVPPRPGTSKKKPAQYSKQWKKNLLSDIKKKNKSTAKGVNKK